MAETKRIKKVAVLGAGVMGSGISAHLANAGLQVLMLDIVPPKLSEEDARKGLTEKSAEFRNRFPLSGKEKLLKMRPAAYYTKRSEYLIEIGNFEDDLGKLADCDWIVEAVTENIEIKRALFEKVAKVRRPGAIITSNTSGIPIAKMVEGFPPDFREHFFVTHFFNPVRYMKLLEIVPGKDTKPELVEDFAKFGETVLGKGIVLAKDTPNFIANRIGVFSMMYAINAMLEDGLTIEEVDKVAGPAMGRPKSAAFRTADMVGLDTLVHVANNCYEALKKDEKRGTFKIPDFIAKMVDKKLLGDKSGGGFYKKVKGESEKAIFAIDPATLEYRPQQKASFQSLSDAKGIEEVGERIKAICAADDKAGKFAWKVVSETLVYAANRLGEIADDVVNIDNAMKWGFNWDLGPFETWDAMGLEAVVERLEKEKRKVPKLVKAMLEAKKTSFYQKKDGKILFFAPGRKALQKIPEKPDVINLAALKEQGRTIKENFSASLIDIGDGAACIEFHSKMNSIDDDIVQMMNFAVDYCEKNCAGLVVGNQAKEAFSAGANIMLILLAAREKQWDSIEAVVRGFQAACMKLKFSEVPVVAAPFGLTLGGGAEVSMGADRILANAELYMGQVEVGVGLVPAGGGTKELLVRNMQGISEDMQVDTLQFVRKAFEACAMAKVSFSAAEAYDIGFLTPSDHFTINRESQIYHAKQMVLGMAGSGYRRPAPRKLKLPGRNAYSIFRMVLRTMRDGNYISDHDMLIGSKLAHIMTGGNCVPAQPVSEQHILDLECEAFLSLCGEEKTQARIEAMLMTGKPLRN